MGINTKHKTQNTKLFKGYPIIDLIIYLKMVLNGVEMNRNGDTVLYQVSAMKEGLKGYIPVRTAMVQVPSL